MGTAVASDTYMRLLIITQVVDHTDPVLGFFVRWLEEFAKHFDTIEVICLRSGESNLPGNVRVYSLGKESEVSKISYLIRFYTYLWRLRGRYDTVFVHMNPEYVLLGGVLWRLFRIPITLWYNHPHRGIRFTLSAILANRLLHTSVYSASADFSKARRMPAGIDTDMFKPKEGKYSRQNLYMQGRIMPSKRVRIAIEALKLVRESIPATLTLVGPEDPIYGGQLRKEFADSITEGSLIFAGPKQHTETPELFAHARVSINLAGDGHFDKSVLESMACETPVVLSSQAFEGLVPDEWVVKENNSRALADALIRLLQLQDMDYTALGAQERLAVIRTQSLSLLAEKIEDSQRALLHSSLL